MLLWIDKIRRDEHASGLVFGALSMFCLVCFLAYTCNVTQITTLKIKMQSAADAAAYSGAVVQANIIALVAFINNMMVWVYRIIVAIIVIKIILAILAALSLIPFIGEAFRWAMAAYQWWESMDDHWIDSLLRVINSLSKIQRAIAKSAVFLIELEVFRIARENGAYLAAAYPLPIGLNGEKAFLEKDPEHPDRFFRKVMENLLGGLSSFIVRFVSMIGGVDVGVGSRGISGSGAYQEDCPHCSGGRCSICGGDGKVPCNGCGGHGYVNCREDDEGNHVHGPRCSGCAGRGWNGCAGCMHAGSGGTPGDGMCWQCNGQGQAQASSAESTETGDLPAPLTLTQAFFETGINVGAWRRRENPIFLPRTSSMPAGIFENPAWGIFTFASARAYSPGFGVGDLRGGIKNLYVLDWRAKLVSLKEGGFFEAFRSRNWRWRNTANPSEYGTPDGRTPGFLEHLMQH